MKNTLPVAILNTTILTNDGEFTLKTITLEEAKELCETFLAMITEGLEGDELKKLKDAIALQNISTMPARVKCAVLAWHTLKNIIEAN